MCIKQKSPGYFYYTRCNLCSIIGIVLAAGTRTVFIDYGSSSFANLFTTLFKVSP